MFTPFARGDGPAEGVRAGDAAKQHRPPRASNPRKFIVTCSFVGGRAGYCIPAGRFPAALETALASYLIGVPGVAHVTGPDGTVSLAPGIPIIGTAPLSTAIAAALVDDSDAVFASAVVPEAALQAAAIAADDNVFAADVGRVSHGKQTLQPLVVVAAPDSIYTPLGVDIVLLTLRPATVASDDAVSSFVTTLFLQPTLMTSAGNGDGILRSDVGWHLFGQLLIDADFVPTARAETLAYIVPDLFKDEEHVDTYPFFLQQLTGGIPEQPRAGVLTGSIKQSVKLTGSIAQPRLTGSHAAGARRSTRR